MEGFPVALLDLIDGEELIALEPLPIREVAIVGGEGGFANGQPLLCPCGGAEGAGIFLAE